VVVCSSIICPLYEKCENSLVNNTSHIIDSTLNHYKTLCTTYRWEYFKGEKKGIVNAKNNSFIWYHMTPKSNLDSILKYGLKINSPPTWNSHAEPWLYLSSIVDGYGIPLTNEWVTLKVDLSELMWDRCGWPFIDTDTEPEDYWQLRVIDDIDPIYIKVYSDDISMKPIHYEYSNADGDERDHWNYPSCAKVIYNPW